MRTWSQVLGRQRIEVHAGRPTTCCAVRRSGVEHAEDKGAPLGAPIAAALAVELAALMVSNGRDLVFTDMCGGSYTNGPFGVRTVNPADRRSTLWCLYTTVGCGLVSQDDALSGCFS